MQPAPRLFTIFQPSHYDLHLDIHRADRIFSGTVNIEGHISRKDVLALHAKELTVHTIEYNGTRLSHFAQEGDLLRVDDPVDIGPCKLRVTFSGKITDAMHGLYPCYYKDADVKKELVATQFESHHAREVFPCIDEPEAKATFALTLTTESGVTVLSNMPTQSQKMIDTRTTTDFETTPRMSPYLLAFVIGDLQKKTAYTKSGVKVSVWATAMQDSKKLDFPLDTAVRTIDFFDEYFGTPYPLPKADHVALPDFTAGAMENWGLITYREITLLADESTAQSVKEYVAMVIAHETSHQWFGNLVTMKWWDDLWLNESFANLMEYVAVDALYPKWNIWNTYAAQEPLLALRRDQLSGVQAVKSTVNHPDEINALFDPAIVYAKGGRLLKMVRTYIGEDAFRRGLKQYFETHAYSNTTGADLWSAFNESSAKDVGRLMDSWISQPGFPIVSLTTTDTGYSLSQKRFVVGQTAQNEAWPIPLFANNQNIPELIQEEHVNIVAEHGFTLLNEHNDGHFITKYDERSWRYIVSAATRNKLSTINRLSLLHEALLMARHGELETTRIIDLLELYALESQESVWNIMARSIDDIKRCVEHDVDAENAYKSFVRSITLPHYQRLGMEPSVGESEMDTKLRALILSLLVYASDNDIITACMEQFRTHGATDKLASDTRASIFACVSRHGTQSDFDALYHAHQTTSDPELRRDIVIGLCATQQSKNISLLIGNLQNSEIVRPQDVTQWFTSLLSHKTSRRSAWRWMVENWQWIEETFSGDKSYDKFPRTSASILSTSSELQSYRTFFEPLREHSALGRTIDMGITEIENKVSWIERDASSIMKRLGVPHES